MATANFHIVIVPRWWLPLYLKALVFFCVLMGRLPDEEKLAAVLRRGLKVKGLRWKSE